MYPVAYFQSGYWRGNCLKNKQTLFAAGIGPGVTIGSQPFGHIG
jgi:hypothetical protein